MAHITAFGWIEIAEAPVNELSAQVEEPAAALEGGEADPGAGDTAAPTGTDTAEHGSDAAPEPEAGPEAQGQESEAVATEEDPQPQETPGDGGEASAAVERHVGIVIDGEVTAGPGVDDAQVEEERGVCRHQACLLLTFGRCSHAPPQWRQRVCPQS